MGRAEERFRSLENETGKVDNHAHRAVADEYGVLDPGPADASRQQAAI